MERKGKSRARTLEELGIMCRICFLKAAPQCSSTHPGNDKLKFLELRRANDITIDA